MASKALVLAKAATKAGEKGAKNAGTKARPKKPPKVKKERKRKITTLRHSQTDLNQTHGRRPRYDRYTGEHRGYENFDGYDGSGGKTVHLRGAQYDSPKRTRRVVGATSQKTDVESDGFARKGPLNPGIQHDRYRHDKRTGKETTINLRPSWLGGWDQAGLTPHGTLSSPRHAEKYINGNKYEVKQRQYQPINAINATGTAYAGGMGLAIKNSRAAGQRRKKRNEKKKKEAFYTRHERGRTQKVRNPHYWEGR